MESESTHRHRTFYVTAGFAALWIELAYTFGALGASLTEPFVNVERYFIEVWETSLIGLGVGGIGFGLVGLAAFFLHSCGIDKACDTLSTVSLALFVPVLAWATFLALDATNAPTFNLHVPAPTWVSSSWVGLLGSPHGFYLLPLAGLLAWAWLMRQSIVNDYRSTMGGTMQ